METAYSYVQRILKQYSIRTKKSLGQNFLINDGVIEQIIQQSGLRTGEAVLEVGPGPGVLTKALAEVAGKVWAVELDRSLCEILSTQFSSKDNVQIINADALKFNIKDLGLADTDKIKLIANLPYYITSPLINHFLQQRQYLDSLTIMVQQEVAERLAAKPGSKDYGILSIAIQVFCEVAVLFVVPPSSFLPPPKVQSAVVKLRLLEEPRINPSMEAQFFKVVKAAFAQRRKTLLNSLSQGLSLNKEILANTLTELEISPSIRAENLSIEHYIKLTTKLFPHSF